MKLTQNKLNELKILAFFTPDFLKAIPYDKESVNLYFMMSERGIGTAEVEARVAEENRTKGFTYLSTLYFSKRNRDLAITSYKEDWGQTCTAIDFVDEPREKVEFISKSLGKPAIMTTWKLFNAKEELDVNDTEILKPLSRMV